MRLAIDDVNGIHSLVCRRVQLVLFIVYTSGLAEHSYCKCAKGGAWLGSEVEPPTQILGMA